MSSPANSLNITQAGVVVFDGVSAFSGRTITGGAGVTVTNGSGVSGNPTISLSGGGAGVDSIAVQTGTSPVVPDSNGLLTINGAVVSAGTNPVRSNGTGANTLALEVQTSQAISAADATKIGLSNFNSAQFSVAATGFVSALSTVNAKYTATAVSYQVLITDVIIGVTSNASARTITMPNAGMIAGQVWTVKDCAGTAQSANNITISGNGATIDGSATFVININYGSVDIFFDGTNFFVK